MHEDFLAALASMQKLSQHLSKSYDAAIQSRLRLSAAAKEYVTTSTNESTASATLDAAIKGDSTAALSVAKVDGGHVAYNSPKDVPIAVRILPQENIFIEAIEQPHINHEHGEHVPHLSYKSTTKKNDFLPRSSRDRPVLKPGTSKTEEHQLFEPNMGRGSYEDRCEMLHLIVDLVEASCIADNPEWSVDEQVAKDIQLLDSIAERQAHIFSEECKLFPADVQIQSMYPLPDVAELEVKLAEHSKQLSSLQQMVQDLAAKHAYNPDEDYSEVESRLRVQLESFLETARSFNLIYSKEIRPWTHMMEVPQLHGFGPTANHLLEAYKMLLKFLGNLRNLRDAHAALAIGTESAGNESSSSVTRIIADCESALTCLNRDLGILSASLAREQGGKAHKDRE